jgi:pimeloyl-ACP methyl ester carboxylesterase
MKPVVFEGRFGWLHAGDGERGVVLCNAFGHEGVWTHKAMRRLAEGLAARGLWVLRFDYAGTGDSVGVDGRDEQLRSAVTDIVAASAWLRQQTGVSHVTLCGLRAGAAFALLAARQSPVDALALLAPVVKGSTYVRELSVVRKTWFDQLAPPLQAAQQETPFSVLGQVYSEAFVASLQSVDLAAALKDVPARPAARALIVHTRAAASEPLRARMDALGMEVGFESFEGFPEFLVESAFSVMPETVIARTVEWIAQGHAVRPGILAVDDDFDAQVCIETPEAIERPVRIGPAGLFGMLCEPRNAPAHGPALLITNTAASAHVGDSRLSVRIARELARQGVASLRVDARGRGDSPAAPGPATGAAGFNGSYAPNITEDVGAAAAWLAQQGYTKIVSFGICSGAFSALRAAATEPALTGAIAVNIPTFNEPTAASLELLSSTPARNSMAGYAISVLDPAKWKRIVSGERSIVPIFKFVLGNLATRLRSRLADLLGFHGDASPSSGIPDDARGLVRVLDRKGVQTVLVYGAYDSGLDLLAAHFGKHGRRLARFANVRAQIMDDIDHALFNPASAAKVTAFCAAMLAALPGQVSSGVAARQEQNASDTHEPPARRMMMDRKA